MQIIPVLFCVITTTCAVATFLLGGVLFAAPPEEKLPELSKPQLHREKTKLEKAVDQAAAMLLQGKLPPTEDGVRFALWLYGEKSDVAYLDIATKMARELVKKDPTLGSAALFWVAQAGGPTFEEAKAINAEPSGYASFVQRRLAMISASRDMMGFADLSQLVALPLPEPSDEIEPTIPSCIAPEPTNNSEVEAIIRSSQLESEFVQLWGDEVSKEMLTSKWRSGDAVNYLDRTLRGWSPKQHKILIALITWEAGLLTGDMSLVSKGEKDVEKKLDSAVKDPKAAAIAGLAAGRMSRHHLQLAIIGDPDDSTVTALRQAAYFLFEPNKVILNLDPKTDSKRMAELMYPADAAPAMFVCVETLCSPPIKNPAELGKQVAEIKKLAAEIQQ